MNLRGSSSIIVLTLSLVFFGVAAVAAPDTRARDLGIPFEG